MTATLKVVLLAFVAISADACSCTLKRSESYADFVCQSALVLRATITSDGDSTASEVQNHDHNRAFNVKAATVYRNVNNVPVPTTVLTPPEDSLCGYEFEVGQEYLILGSTDKGAFLTNICSHNKQWSKLSNEVKDALENGSFATQCQEKNM